MSKDAWRAFLRWLDEASIVELDRRHKEALALLEQLTERELRAELRRMLRLIEEERLIRLSVLTRKGRQRP